MEYEFGEGIDNDHQEVDRYQDSVRGAWWLECTI